MEKPPDQKLSPYEVREIKELLKEGYSQVSIADMYGVSQSTISLIKIGKRWGWIK